MNNLESSYRFRRFFHPSLREAESLRDARLRPVDFDWITNFEHTVSVPLSVTPGLFERWRRVLISAVEDFLRSLEGLAGPAFTLRCADHNRARRLIRYLLALRPPPETPARREARRRMLEVAMRNGGRYPAAWDPDDPETARLMAGIEAADPNIFAEHDERKLWRLEGMLSRFGEAVLDHIDARDRNPETERMLRELLLTYDPSDTAREGERVFSSSARQRLGRRLGWF